MKRYVKSSLDPEEAGIPEENRNGDCFKVALNTFFKDPVNYILVHGVVTGQGPLEGIQYCHAWVIDKAGDFVIDNTQSRYKKMPLGLYYMLGNIEITREYDLKSVTEMMNKYKTYGPWDPVFDNYF